MSTGTITPPVASVTSLSTGEAKEEKHSCSLPRKHKRPKNLPSFFFFFFSYVHRTSGYLSLLNTPCNLLIY
jgi:hypothetical protein